MTWTDAEVEWAAECLWNADCVEPTWMGPECGQSWMASARHALDHGYRPPPKPKTVREELCELILRDAPKVGGWEKDAADAILSKFRVERKTDEP